MKFKKSKKDQTWHPTLQFEFESKKQFHHFMEAVLCYQTAREAVTGKKRTLAETFVWVYEKTGE